MVYRLRREASEHQERLVGSDEGWPTELITAESKDLFALCADAVAE